MDHFTHLGLATAWEQVAIFLASEDEPASRLAWSYAADHYGAYNEAWRAHLPASRWDHDYAPELGEARRRAGRGAAQAFAESGPRETLVQLTLERRLDEAIACVTERPRRRSRRALLAILAYHCRLDSRETDTKRLDAWSKEPSVAEIAGRIAQTVSERTGEPLSHLDYPTRVAAPSCVALGFARSGLWRALAVVLDRDGQRAAFVSRPSDELPRFDLDDDDTEPVAAAAVQVLASIGGGSPAIDLVNATCDTLQVVSGNIEVLGTQWLPRFGGRASCLDLHGTPRLAYPSIVRLEPAPGGISISVDATCSPGLIARVSTPQEIVDAAPHIVAAVRTAIDSSAAKRGQRS